MSSDNTTSESSRYDLVVFGATGFTGQFVVEEIARSVDEEGSLTWAIAGRSMQKLQGVLARASKTTGKAAVIGFGVMIQCFLIRPWFG